MVVFQRQVPEVLFGLLRVLFVAALTGLVAACAARPFPPNLTEERKADVVEVLVDAYEQASENYVDRVEVAELALAGLRDVSRVHTPMSVQQDAGTITVRFFTKEPALLQRRQPADDDLTGWSNLVADALIAVTGRAGTPPVPPKHVFRLYLEGVAKALGPEASYVTDEDFRDLLFRKYDSGVLFTYRRTSAGVEIIRLDPDGRLAAAGLKPGDIVTQVDNADVERMSPFNFDQRLWGPEGSEVVLTVSRQNSAPSAQIRLTRWKLAPPTYQQVRDGRIIKLMVPYFNLQAARDLTLDVDRELSPANPQGPSAAGLILDLRRSVDGNEFSITELANAFLGKGTISVQRGQDAEPKRVINASWPDHSENLPLVVLVDGLTVNGAEIVAAALQDNGRAIIIGSSTLGDGLVEKNVSLYNMGVIRMPVARAYAPSGYGISGRGVLPNVCTSLDGVTFDATMAALRRGEGLTAQVDRTRDIDPEDRQALAAHRALCPAVVDEGDLALDLARAILNDPSLYARLIAEAGS